jgi:hypothetical protein
MAQPKRQQIQKVLRIGVVQDGKIVQERLIKAGDPVSIGESTKNTFVIPPTTLPKRFQLFQPGKAGGYVLHFTEEMKGKISYKNAIVPLGKLKEQGDAVRKGAEYLLPLNDGNRGKVGIGSITILFQFVPPPPEPMRAGQTQDFRPKLFDEDDPVFYGFLGLFSALATVFMIYVYTTEPVERVALDEIPDRFTQIVMDPEPLPDIPEPTVDESLEGPSTEKASKKEETKPDEGGGEKAEKKELSEAEKAAAEAQRRKELESQVESNPLLAAIIGTRGESGSDQKVQDLFGESDFAGQDLDSALQGVTGADVATSAKLEAKTGQGGTRKDASIGDLKGASTGDVGVGSGPATKVSGSLSLGDGDTMLEQGDATSVRKVVNKYKGQIKYCYEAELKANPSLAGRVEVQFTVNKGRVVGASLFANTTGSDSLGKCITGKVRTWRFPTEIQGEVIYPFILTPSS